MQIDFSRFCAFWLIDLELRWRTFLVLALTFYLSDFQQVSFGLRPLLPGIYLAALANTAECHVSLKLEKTVKSGFTVLRTHKVHAKVAYSVSSPIVGGQFSWSWFAIFWGRGRIKIIDQSFHLPVFARKWGRRSRERCPIIFFRRDKATLGNWKAALTDG